MYKYEVKPNHYYKENNASVLYMVPLSLLVKMNKVMEK
jgi:hypothetical protein